MPSTGGGNFSDQLLNVPVVLPTFLIESFHVPLEPSPLIWLRGVCGLNGPMSKGAGVLVIADGDRFTVEPLP